MPSKKDAMSRCREKFRKKKKKWGVKLMKKKYQNKGEGSINSMTGSDDEL